MNQELRLKIEYVPIDSLTPYEKNARKHDEKDVAYIKQSIQEFQMSDPIGVWGEKNIIVEGHGRWMALKELGYTEVPIIRLDHLTDKQRKAYALAHNKTAERSEWDMDLLISELADLNTDIDMSSLGFDDILKDDKVDEFDDAELKDTFEKDGEKEIECPYCGGKILI